MKLLIVDAGGYQIGEWGVYRPQNMPGPAIVHNRVESEIHYVLEGAGVLVTGGSLVDSRPSPSVTTSVLGSGIADGVSRRVGPGDVVIIPGGVPHWWSSLESEISYITFRPDPKAHRQLR